MKRLTPVALAVLALLGVWGWLRFIHDPAVRARAALDARNAVVDSMVVAWEDSVAAAAQRDSLAQVTQDSLTRLADSLRARTPRTRVWIDSLVQTVPDTALVRALMAGLAVERATADSARRTDSARVALLEFRLAERDRRLAQAGVTIDSLVHLKEAWRKEARRFPLGLGCTIGPAAGLEGLEPVVVACGATVRF